MKLQRIDIRAAESWEKHKGYAGEITFSGDLGKVQIRTDDELSRKILGVCAEQIAAAARQVATDMTADLLEARPVQAIAEITGEPS